MEEPRAPIVAPSPNLATQQLDAIAQVNAAAGQGGGPLGTVLPPTRSGIGASSTSLPPQQEAPFETVAAPIPPSSPPVGFLAISLVERIVLAENGEAFPITNEEYKNLIGFCFNAFVRAKQQQIYDLQDTLGLAKEEEDDGAEKVPGVQEDEGSGEVQSGQPPTERP